METKTYRVRSMREAVDLIKEDLGPEASILHSRRIVSRWRSLLGQGELLEVIASPDADVPSRIPHSTNQANTTKVDDSYKAADSFQTSDNSVSLERDDSDKMPSEGRSTFAGTATSDRGADVPDEKLPSHETFPRVWASEQTESTVRNEPGLACQEHENGMSFERWLAKSDFPPDVIQEMMETVADAASRVANDLSERVMDGGSLSKRQVGRLLACQLNTAHGIEVDPEAHAPKVIAIVGPTGVGKTTTLAKLAAGYHISQKLRVGLITVDTFRIAAIEQLRTYARILELPMEVVTTAVEMQTACERLRSMDVILIDTYGASPKDWQHIDELRQILRAARPHEVALVASCMSSASGFVRSLDAYSGVGATSLVISKLDEADALGHLWAPIQDSGLPIRYVTTGQNVPDDIETADAFRLASAFLESFELQRFPNSEEAIHA